MPVDRYAVLGHPIGHSLSPAMQNAAFAAAGLAASYEAHDITPEMLDAHVACLRYGYSGFNLTIPHKEAVRRNLDFVVEEARTIGAVNTVAIRDGVLTGFNTDGEGFLASLKWAGVHPDGARAVVFGAGGSARAVVHALRQRGAAISVAARSPERARDLAQQSGEVRVVSADDPVLRNVVETADLIVNTTPVGMGHLEADSLLDSGWSLRTGAAVVDLVYGRETPLLAQARAAGCIAIDGLQMLVEQGAAAFRIWTGVEPDTALMRAACLAELEVRSCSVS